MTDEAAFEGFLFEMTRADVNSPGGVQKNRLYAIARPPIDVAGLPRTARLIDSGPHVLARARELGVGDDDLKIVGPED
jgi:hypothetical protein